jgi:hypothetical protein
MLFFSWFQVSADSWFRLHPTASLFQSNKTCRKSSKYQVFNYSFFFLTLSEFFTAFFSYFSFPIPFFSEETSGLKFFNAVDEKIWGKPGGIIFFGHFERDKSWVNSYNLNVLTHKELFVQQREKLILTLCGEKASQLCGFSEEWIEGKCLEQKAIVG